MNDYTNKASQEAEFLLDTLLTGENVFTPGDKEFYDYVDGVKSLDELISENRKLDHQMDLSMKKEEYRHEEEMAKLEAEKEAKMNEQLLEEEKERNRHKEEMHRIDRNAKNERKSKAATILGGIAKAGLYTAGITIICFSEETRIISKTALDFAKAAIRL